MAETFPCPHCQHRYPALDSLVGRKVRCSQCGKVFMLGTDGVAVAVDPAVPSPPPSGPAPASAGDPPAAAKSDRSQSERVATTDAAAGSSRSDATKDRRRRDSARAETLRRSLRLNLQSAAKKAAAAVEDESRTASATRATPQAAVDHRRDLTQVRLTGSGHAVGRRYRRWLVSSMAVVVVVIIVFLVTSGAQDPLVAVLEDYAAGPASMHERLDRTWFRTHDGLRYPLLLATVGRVRVVQRERYDLSGLRSVLDGPLQGLRPYDELGCFIAPEQVPELRYQYARAQDAVREVQAAQAEDEAEQAEGMAEEEGGLRDTTVAPGVTAATDDVLLNPRQRAVTALREQDMRVITYSEAVDHLRAAGLEDPLRHYLSMGLAGEAVSPPSLRERWLSGTMPEVMEIAVLRGRDGLRLRPEGLQMRGSELPSYTALLARFHGPGYDGVWRVFDVHTGVDPVDGSNALWSRDTSLALDLTLE